MPRPSRAAAFPFASGDPGVGILALCRDASSRRSTPFTALDSGIRPARDDDRAEIELPVTWNHLGLWTPDRTDRRPWNPHDCIFNVLFGLGRFPTRRHSERLSSGLEGTSVPKEPADRGRESWADETGSWRWRGGLTTTSAFRTAPRGHRPKADRTTSVFL